MGSIDLISAPLSQAQLTARYEALIDDPRYRNVPGRLELNAWGQIVMTPTAQFWHYRLAARLSYGLRYSLGGEAVQEVPIAIGAIGTFVADLAWCSPAFLAEHGHERVLQRAPEICVEVLSPSNSVHEIDEKRSAYLRAGAQEVWIVDAEAKAITVYDGDGLRRHSRYAVDLTGLFDR